MDIDVPIRCFGEVAIEPLATAILAQDEAAWCENQQRQRDYEVHEQTRSIVLLFAEVDRWPAIDVTKQPGWDRLAPRGHTGDARHHPPLVSARRHHRARHGGEAARPAAGSFPIATRTRHSPAVTAFTCPSPPIRGCGS